MFHRVTPEEWGRICAIVGFSLTFLVFITAAVRAIRLRRPEADRLARIPLHDTEIHRHE